MSDHSRREAAQGMPATKKHRKKYLTFQKQLLYETSDIIKQHHKKKTEMFISSLHHTSAIFNESEALEGALSAR
jgi:hypothetical protein